jgi:hypothetical protein
VSIVVGLSNGSARRWGAARKSPVCKINFPFGNRNKNIFEPGQLKSKKTMQTDRFSKYIYWLASMRATSIP